MPQQYYEQGFKRQFEAAIPVLIILLLIIGVIALNPSLVRGVPILGDLFGGSAVNVLIIGESASEANDWRAHLSGNLALQVFGNPLNVEVMTDAQYNKISSADWLDSQGYDVVMLTATDLTPSMQVILKNWVAGGGNMLVIGTGGTQANGRWAELSSVMPVSCPLGDCSGVYEQVYAPTMYIRQGMFDNGLAKNVDTATPLTAGNGSINVANIPVTASHILYIGGFPSGAEVKAGQTGDVYPGVAEMGDVAGGSVVWMSFNPTTENIDMNVEEGIVINTIAYIIGATGYQSA
ncbi:MAG: hypothetical protein KAW41_05550 [Candidatus Diapherotrites archaeon]|nr:hypothetical protein [Candidatus Diapherotrites archaeon]